MRDISANKSVTLLLKKSCGSDVTEKGYMEGIKKFFEHIGIEPDELVAAWKKAKYQSYKAREKFLEEWTEKIEDYIYTNFEDWTAGSRMQHLAVVVSFFKHNRISVYPEREKHVFTKYHNRDITRQEIRRILEHSSKRDKAFFIILAESGVRPETLVQLRYKHIKKDFEAKKVPMMIDLPSELLKDRVEARWTFIGVDGFKALRDYLKPRLNNIKSEDKIFLPRRSDYSTVTRDSFSGIFSKIVLKLGIAESTGHRKPKQIRLYSLRKYFMNNVKCDTAFREWWMGHKTTQTHYVSRDPERHREEYAQAYQNLRIYKSESEQSVRQLRELLAKKEEELAELRKSLKLIQPLLELAERNPKILQGMCDRERQRLLRLTEKWSNRARRKK